MSEKELINKSTEAKNFYLSATMDICKRQNCKGIDALKFQLKFAMRRVTQRSGGDI